MQQILASWQALDTRRRFIAVAASALVFAAILMLSGMTSRGNFSLLYAGLDPGQAGEVVAAVEQKGVKFEVRGDSIYVDSAQRDELRMMLAAEGLPKSGGNGYELLDSLSGFGTTSQMFDAAYWRAKEGELARTILSSSSIRSARVHIAASTGPSFQKDRKSSASVTITTNGTRLPAQQVKALQFLVASAVSGMKPEDVSVIDSVAGLVSTTDASPAQVGSDLSTELRKNVERLLEARVGYGSAVVEVSVQTVSEREAITERRFDPQNRVAISTDTTESTKSSDSTKGDSVTVASNLPDGDAANNNSGKSQSQSAETRERTNYEVSETTREVLKAPGDIKRITVAVLVDGVQANASSGNGEKTARSQEELDSLRDLVASAVGFDESRGDIITIRSMIFNTADANAGTAVASGIFSTNSVDVMQLVQFLVLGIIALILALFVVKPLLLQKKQVGDQVGSLPQLTGAPQDDDQITFSTMDQMDDIPSTTAQFSMDDVQDPDGASSTGVDKNDPMFRLKNLIEQRRGESVEILKGWMEASERRA